MGPVSSIFDFLTFFLMLVVFKAAVSVFQTAWFVESLSTQALVVFVLRTRKTPFYKSKPGRYLLISTLAVVVVSFALPYTPLGAVFRFSPPPATFYLALVGIIAVYLFLVEVVKNGSTNDTFTSWNRALCRKNQNWRSRKSISLLC